MGLAAFSWVNCHFFLEFLGDLAKICLSEFAVILVKVQFLHAGNEDVEREARDVCSPHKDASYGTAGTVAMCLDTVVVWSGEVWRGLQE